jgi:hypothetical protein
MKEKVKIKQIALIVIATVVFIGLIGIMIKILKYEPAKTENVQVGIDDGETVSLTIDQMQQIDNIIESYTNKEVISNINNEQADVILQDLGITLQNLEFYSFSTDVRQDTAYLVGIFKSKNGVHDEVEQELWSLTVEKQRYYQGILGTLQDTPEVQAEYSNAENTTMCDIGDYIVIVMDNDTDIRDIYSDFTQIVEIDE